MTDIVMAARNNMERCFMAGVLQYPLRRHLLALAAIGNVLPAYAEEPSRVSTSKLDTVVVTASGNAQKEKDAPASMSVITREELENKSFHSLGDVLEDVEGIDVVRGGKAGGTNISIRGMPADYTLILIDGKRLNRSSGGVRPNGFGDVDTNFIPPLSAIERIEVVRGPMSTLYGSDAMGGVINIITRKVANAWTGSAQIDGTYQFNNDFGDNEGANFNVSGPLKENLLGLSVRGSIFHRGKSNLSYTDKDGSQQKLGFSGLGEEDTYTVGARLALTPNKQHDIIFDADLARQKFSNKNGELGTLNSQVAKNRAGGGYEDEMKFDRDRFALSHTGRWNFGTSDISMLYDTTDTQGRTNPMHRPRRADDGTPRKLQYDNYIFDAKLVSPFMNDRHWLTVGGQYWKQKLEDTLAENPQQKFDQYQWALFAEDEWRIIQPLALTVGLRYDNNEQFGGHWSPRGYLVWDANEKLTVKGGVSQGYKAPRINQTVDGIIGFGAQGTLPLLGSANLKPETSTTTEAGFIYDNQDGFTLNATYFYTVFKDKIENQRIPNCLAPGGNVAGCLDMGDWSDRNGKPIPDYRKAGNIASVRIQGLELGTRIPLTPSWALSANYTLTQSEQKTGAAAGHPLGNTPEHMFNARVDWSITNKANAWLGMEWRSQQYRGQTPDNREAHYSPYTLMNLGGSYTVNKWLSLRLAIYNLLDKNFVNYQDNPTNPAAATYSNTYYQVLEGRRVWLSANLTF
ncbi:MAG: TonB-dependent receptor [Rhodocyclaceae bacterium]